MLTATERVDVIRTARAARVCAEARRMAALPEFDQTVKTAGNHLKLADGGPPSTLGLPTMDLVQRIVTDAGRMANADAYYSALVHTHLSPGAYVEIVALVACLTQVDSFAFASGAPLAPIPVAAGNEPPTGIIALGQECRAHVARVPTVPIEAANEPETQQVCFGKAGAPSQKQLKVPHVHMNEWFLLGSQWQHCNLKTDVLLVFEHFAPRPLPRTYCSCPRIYRTS